VWLVVVWLVGAVQVSATKAERAARCADETVVRSCLVSVLSMSCGRRRCCATLSQSTCTWRTLRVAGTEGA
jgi:hypothetical protein